MATTRRTVEIRIGANSRDAEKAFDRVGKAAKQAGDDIEQVGDADPFSEITDMGDDFGSKLGGIGEMAAGLFTGALVAGAAVAGATLFSAVTEALEQEASTAKLEAALGGGEWAEQAGEVAGDLYVDGFGESVADTADAVKAVLQGGILPKDAVAAEVEAMSASVLTFVDVLDQDLQESVNAVATMIRTGLAKDGTEALDLLTRGVQAGADKAGDLAETFTEYGTQFRELGLSGAEATGLMVQGLEAGARDADFVADALKEFAIRAQDGTELSRQAFERLGLSAEDMIQKIASGGPGAKEALDQVLDGLRAVEDPATRSQIAVALFGTKAEDLQDALLALDPTTAVDTLGQVGGATDDLGTAYDTASAKIEVFKREAMQKLVDFIGNTVIPKLQELWAWIQTNLIPIWQRWRGRVAEVFGALSRLKNSIVNEFLPALGRLMGGTGQTSDTLNRLGGILGGVATGIQFLVSMVNLGVQGFSRLIDGVRTVIGWLRRLKDFIPTIPSLSVGSMIPGFGFLSAFGAEGGIVTSSGIEGFAGGGIAGTPSSDTVPSMLTPGEMVLTAGDQKNLLGMIRGGQGGINVAVTINGSLIHERDLDATVADAVNRGLRKTGRINIVPSAVRR